MARERVLDVSELEPPAPLVNTLEEVETLIAGEYLRMLHRRDPCLLRDNLDQQGFNYITRSQENGWVQMFIWRKGDTEAETAARAAAGENIS
ncbi:hypothetical protein MNBD_GAMMA24-711 [hydrothermal vent metagenome]|uniref:DUF2249 domain-containing protein n=1 Tax=hydrothermal vent metagenome TaxID=652676 RepID=A0A3B1BNR3_9ZZZZ